MADLLLIFFTKFVLCGVMNAYMSRYFYSDEKGRSYVPNNSLRVTPENKSAITDEKNG